VDSNIALSITDMSIFVSWCLIILNLKRWRDGSSDLYASKQFDTSNDIEGGNSL